MRRFLAAPSPGVRKQCRFLRVSLKVKEYELLMRNFSDVDCFGSCIHEHIDLGIKYDPSTGIYGMNFFVVLVHLGYRAGLRTRCKSRVRIQHRVQKRWRMLVTIMKFSMYVNMALKKTHIRATYRK